MSRILMISTNREMSPQPVVPMGAAWVAEALHAAGHQVRFLDLCFERDPLRSIARVIESFRPEGIGISVRNLDNCDFLAPKSYLPELKEITDFIRSRSDARILLGGAAVSIMPLQILQYLDLEFAVVGEGESAAVAFFCEKNASTPGLVCRSRVQQAGASRVAVPGHQVVPRMQRWIDTRSYLQLEPVLPVQGKRGCANRCLYCTYSRIEGSSWRIRDAASVADEIAAAMRETGAREFEFVDSVFNEPEGYLEALLEEILARNLKARFRAASLSPKGLTKGQVTLMERAGFTSAVITPETACDVTLRALRKDFAEQEVHRAAEAISRSGIRSLWCFIVGGPKEDETTLGKTIAFINGRIGKKDCAFITTGLRILPHTALHETAVAEAVLEASDSLLMPRFYFSPFLSPDKAREMLQNRILDLERCIFLSDTQKSSIGTFRRLGTMIRLPGPFWGYASYMNRLSAGSRVVTRGWPSSPARKN